MRSVLPVVAACAVLLVGCGAPAYDTAGALFQAAGGEAWCGGELTLTVDPWIGRCADGDDRVVIGVHLAEGELVDSVAAADDALAILVPSDPERLPAWQLRSQDREALLAAAEQLDGVLLHGRDEIDAWLDERPASEEPEDPSQDV